MARALALNSFFLSMNEVNTQKEVWVLISKKKKKIKIPFLSVF